MNMVKGKDFKVGDVYQGLVATVKIVSIGKPNDWNFIPMKVKDKSTGKVSELKFHAENEYKLLTFFNRS